MVYPSWMFSNLSLDEANRWLQMNSADLCSTQTQDTTDSNKELLLTHTVGLEKKIVLHISIKKEKFIKFVLTKNDDFL